MDGNPLPTRINGQWIWLRQVKDAPEAHVFFRRDFTLDEIPSSAELWIAARSFFHLFVNGHHLSYALGTFPGTGSYVWCFDLTYLLSTGNNTLAVLAHNTEVARTSCNRQPSGFWCQMHVDGSPTLWSDHNWQALAGDCYAGNRPRRSSSSAFSERIDLNLFPHGWSTTGFGGHQWLHPDICQAYDPRNWALHPFPAPEFTVQSHHLRQLVIAGTWQRSVATTHVQFEHILASAGPGVYAAETYLWAETANDIPFELFADNPYRLFLNGGAIKEQGLRPLAIGTSFLSCKSLCFRQGDTVDPEGRLPLQAGWNRLDLYLDVEPGTCGATLVMPTLRPAELAIRRMPDPSALPGWALAGPLRTPMVNILGNLTVAGVASKEYFIPLEEMPADEAVELTMFDYLPKPAAEAAEDADQPSAIYEQGIDLKQGEYLVFALDRARFGCPKFVFAGTRGDIVDVVTGTEIVAGQLLPMDGMREHVDTVILTADETEWMSCFPNSVRFVMVVGRVVETAVRLRRGAVHARTYAFPNPGHFSSSDNTLNQIWTVGRNTLEATIQEAFIDSPAKDQTQYVPDAFIESASAYFTLGNYSLAAKGLVEFADSQFETGELPAASPSGVYLNIPDYSLLWPVWLRNHYTHTGDRKLLDQLLPNIERLFAYFDEIADRETGVLDDLGRRFKAYCFLDHGAIDRRGVITGLNALYSRALLSGAWLFETVGREEMAAILRQRLARLVAAIREMTWVPAEQRFADCWAHGHRSPQCSMQTNVLALYGGLALPEHYDAIFEGFFGREPPYDRVPGGSTDNPYFKYFILETAFALGRREWAFNYMKWYWGGMLESGAATWWELFDPQAPDSPGGPGGSCHGYGVSPNAFLIREVAGVRPAIPGYSAIYFNPLIAAVKSVTAKIPTRYGHITIDWALDDQGRLEASINATYPLAVIPELDAAVADTATLHVGDEVSIFAESPEA